MGKKTKTWKLGEVAKGGVITVEVTDTKATIIGKEWDFSAGSRKSSNQSNAKEFQRREVNFNNGSVEAHRAIAEELNDLTTHYYAEQIMEWIEQNAPNFKKYMFW